MEISANYPELFFQQDLEQTKVFFIGSMNYINQKDLVNIKAIFDK